MKRASSEGIKNWRRKYHSLSQRKHLPARARSLTCEGKIQESSTGAPSLRVDMKRLSDSGR